MDKNTKKILLEKIKTQRPGRKFIQKPAGKSGPVIKLELDR